MIEPFPSQLQPPPCSEKEPAGGEHQASSLLQGTRSEDKRKNIHPSSKYLHTWQSLPWLPTQMQTDAPRLPLLPGLRGFVYWAKNICHQNTFISISISSMIRMGFYFCFFPSRQHHYWSRSGDNRNSTGDASARSLSLFLSQGQCRFLSPPLILLFFNYIKIFYWGRIRNSEQKSPTSPQTEEITTLAFHLFLFNVHILNRHKQYFYYYCYCFTKNSIKFGLSPPFHYYISWVFFRVDKHRLRFECLPTCRSVNSCLIISAPSIGAHLHSS